jgi:hypothetical protein
MTKAIENLNTGILAAIKNLDPQKRIFFRSSCLGFCGQQYRKGRKDL